MSGAVLPGTVGPDTLTTHTGRHLSVAPTTAPAPGRLRHVLLALALAAATTWTARTGLVDAVPDAVPLTWRVPGPAALLLLPGVVVLGLLLARVVIDDPALLRPAGRAALVWAAVCTAWTAWGVVDLYDGVGRLLQSGNLTEVMAADAATSARTACLGAGLIVAAVVGRAEAAVVSVALAALVVTTVLGVLLLAPAGAAAGHGGAAPSVLVPWVALAQTLAVVAWSACLVALLAVRGGPLRRRAGLVRVGRLLTWLVVVTGLLTVVAGLVLPTGPTPVAMAALQVALLGLVARTGARHRRRVVHVVASGDLRARSGRLGLAGLAGAEAVVALAIVLLAAVAPLG